MRRPAPPAESCQARNIPEWGGKIFSPLCVCMRPDTPEELGGFMKYAIALTRAHLMVSEGSFLLSCVG